MNLNLTANGKKVNLWQTPTWFTYIAMTDDDGLVQSEIKGEKALGVLKRYSLWVNRRSIDTIVLVTEQDKKEYLDLKNEIEEHLQYINMFKNEKLVFYIQ